MSHVSLLRRYVACDGDDANTSTEDQRHALGPGARHRGERLVRFAYTTGGVARRGPVTLRAEDLERLRAALTEHPQLAEALLGGGA